MFQFVVGGLTALKARKQRMRASISAIRMQCWARGPSLTSFNLVFQPSLRCCDDLDAAMIRIERKRNNAVYANLANVSGTIVELPAFQARNTRSD